MKGPRAPIADLAEGERLLSEETSHYLGRVLRLRDGDLFVAFDGAAVVECDGRVVHMEGRRARVALGPVRAAAVRSQRELRWVHGLAKGDKCDAIVRDATELGATWLAFAETERAVVRLTGDRARGRDERFRRIAQEAARQCGRGDAPEVAPVAPWTAQLEAAAEGATCFCLYEGASQLLAPLLPLAIAQEGPLTFAAGPEGGLSAAEAAAAEGLGYRLVSLGPRILRTETVPAAVLGAVLLHYEY